MLKISTSGVCPKCNKATLWYEDGKFVCSKCGRKYTSKEITQTMSDLFEITTGITKKEFCDKVAKLKSLTDRFNADLLGYDPDTSEKGKVGLLDIGWESGYPVRLNMLVQELNEILD